MYSDSARQALSFDVSFVKIGEAPLKPIFSNFFLNIFVQSNPPEKSVCGYQDDGYNDKLSYCSFQ